MGKRKRKISSQSEGWQAREAATIFSNFMIVGAALRGRPILPAPSTCEDDGNVTNGVATECHPYNYSSRRAKKTRTVRMTVTSADSRQNWQKALITTAWR